MSGRDLKNRIRDNCRVQVGNSSSLIHSNNTWLKTSQNSSGACFIKQICQISQVYFS